MEAREFVTEHLSGVLRLSDTAKREEYLSTLRMALDGISMDEISKIMNVHRQTVRYRMSILSRLLGIDEFLGEARVNVALALRLYDVQTLRDETL